MATVYGSKVNNVWRAYMTYTVTTTPTQVKVSITSGLNIPNDGYSTHRSFTATISGTGQTTVSGSISNKKYVGVLTKAIKTATYTWNRASTKQTKTIKTVLKGYGESTTSSCSASISIPALAPATITFDANSGSGTVPTAISTYVGVANTIPSNSLTRTGYTFNGWNTASDGSGTAYTTGSTITPTGDVTLYAQWQTTYVKPEIQNLLAFRTADAIGGASPTVTSTGETGFCKFELVGGANYTFTSASVQFGTATAKSMTQSGNIVYSYSTPDSIAQTSAYTVKITVVVTGTDGIQRTYTDSTYISKAVPVFDVASNGNCFAFFGTATDGLTDPKLLINGELAFGTAASAAVTMANLGIADYIVEQGTSGIWTYRKYSSGTIECWTTTQWATPTLTMTAISSSGTYKSNTVSMPFPTDLFIDIENCFNVRFGFMSSGTYLLSVMNSAPSNSVLPVVIVKGGSSTSACFIYAHAVGKWK